MFEDFPVDEVDLRAPLGLLGALEKIEAAILLGDEENDEKIDAAKKAAFEWLRNGKEGLEAVARLADGEEL